MIIKKIDNINFKSKQKFVSTEQLGNIRKLTKLMNADTRYSSSDTRFQANLVGAVKTKDAIFHNDANFIIPVSEDKLLYTGSDMKFGKVKIEVSNETGEIIACKKPFLMSFKKVLKKMNNYLNIFIENYNNKEIVTKNNIRIDGFTEKGMNIILKAQENIMNSLNKG